MEATLVAETKRITLDVEDMAPLNEVGGKSLVSPRLQTTSPELGQLDKAHHEGALPDGSRPNIHVLIIVVDELEDKLPEERPLPAHEAQPRRPLAGTPHHISVLAVTTAAEGGRGGQEGGEVGRICGLSGSGRDNQCRRCRQILDQS